MTLNQTMRVLAHTGILFAALLLFLGQAAPVSAQGPSFGLRPQESGKGYFEYTIAAGESVEDALVVNNPNDVPLSLEIWVARGATMAAGGITYVDDTSGPAQWVTLLEPENVALAAETNQSLPFEVSVPPGTPPGEYVVGFLATANVPEPAETQSPATEELAEGTSGFNVVVISRVAVAVIITVPVADRCEALISALTSTAQNGRWQLGMNMQNTGNVHFKGSGDVTARPAGGGEPVAQSPFTVDYFIPGDTIEYPLTLDTYPAAGDYAVEVNLITDCGFETTYTQEISIDQDDVEQAVAEAQPANPPSGDGGGAAAVEAARMQAQADLIRSIGLLLGGLAALLVAGVAIVYVMRRPKAA